MALPGGKLTNGLIFINVLIFLGLWISGLEQDAIIRGGMFPIRLGAGFPELEAMGGLVPAWLTPISSAFLHSGLMHIGFNMVMLLFCGRFVEQALGPGLMAFLYFAGAYGAALAEFLFNGSSTIPIVGASGAISAILGAYALLFARNQVKPVGPIPGHIVRIVWLSLAWIGIQLMIGIATQGSLTAIAIYAHIGGFVTGLLMTRPLLEWRFRSA
ncbi:rhomboid family intramembrane serine protease [Parasphingorhabdus halotolerans]|uniref:Rhomboid family intramembrane serine protease n=1 Tax=Parasphingorhabdus halotolerans TaxID=2725558 RepID=A0A6H2DIM7_9SPHN|nr:rhomboid family intramembrane serine protease [Parasphingorhabdus halotolerans]QJB68184.1 rhomboid family intramembrane serine protease [Parasphingorhabdus halotolerans]